MDQTALRVIVALGMLRLAVTEFRNAWEDALGSDRWSEDVGDQHLPALKYLVHEIGKHCDRINVTEGPR